jgi:hypothetical protein
MIIGKRTARTMATKMATEMATKMALACMSVSCEDFILPMLGLQLCLQSRVFGNFKVEVSQDPVFRERHDAH